MLPFQSSSQSPHSPAESDQLFWLRRIRHWHLAWPYTRNLSIAHFGKIIAVRQFAQLGLRSTKAFQLLKHGPIMTNYYLHPQHLQLHTVSPTYASPQRAAPSH